MADNGNGNGGGNTSVYWEMVQGRKPNPRPPKPYTGPTPAPRGAVKVHNIVEGHTDDDFGDIGKPDHQGLFKVVLRFRDVDWQKVPADERAWLEKVVTRNGTNRYLTVHVPAIKRELPAPNEEWGDQPWEIHWEW
jgi:hypothetical protein